MCDGIDALLSRASSSCTLHIASPLSLEITPTHILVTSCLFASIYVTDEGTYSSKLYICKYNGCSHCVWLQVLKDATPNSVLNDTDDEDATEGNRRIKSCPGDLQDDASSDGSIGKAHSLAIEEEALTTHASDEVAPICVRTLGLLRQVSSLDPQCPTSSREFLWLSSFNNPIFDTSSHGEDMAVEGMLSKQSSPEQVSPLSMQNLFRKMSQCSLKHIQHAHQ